ncbi:ribosomal RNA processing protein 1 homolog A isoform X2 [Carassius auratus]|uniref:Ribosomal RNA processing protein 1 homolog A isoform X2 n=1 Tax=Carassius auratus TaxID=7957 RepID=A0A6P6Q5S6_CARAU|nr:ribosomal RNA processing protein 1 homolog A-like isoform X2 [Carassius auratus]
MASTQEAEIIFAQKLASNEKPVRSKALVKLRKYIIARSERAEGFSEEELLKIWKGLFYCMWMQDKPLLQEELSTKISRLLHSFRTLDSQFLYLKTFLLTMKREWNGIDRLRMDKFYQLVRFVFREVFEMLKRQQWESRLVTQFLQLFSAQLLHSSSVAPAGLVLHVLDLYMTELALVGSAELTAEQNQTFIEPFFKTVAKTKDRVLLKAIGSNIFNTIVDQVPFAIQDLQREMGQSAELDSSDESEEQQHTDETETTALSHKPTDCEEEDALSEDADDEDTCGPVLQFDYGAIADSLFAMASHSNIQSFNRSKIYKFVKIFRDLSEGVFPQDEVEKVSSEEEDVDDNGRKKRKRRRQRNKGMKDEESLKKSEDLSESTAASDHTDTSQDTTPKKKSKKKKKRSVEGQQTAPSETQDSTGAAEEKLESSVCDSQQESSCSEPALQLKKKQRRKRTVSGKTCETAEETDHCSQMDISITSAEIVTAGPQKKKQKLKKKAKGAECEVTGSVSDVPAVDVSTASQTQTHSAKASPKTPVKKRKQKDVVSDLPETETNGDAETVPTEGPLRTKKIKQKPSSVRVRAERKRRAMEDEVKPAQLNGHTEQTRVKRHKTITAFCQQEAEEDVKVKEFVLRQKRAPTPIFCKAAGHTHVASKKVLPASKSEMKKVTFGLKNNKTMEFRKTDQSSLLSPARQSAVPFDPKRTPKSGVLKSPTSSPALRKRAMAADFF